MSGRLNSRRRSHGSPAWMGRHIAARIGASPSPCGIAAITTTTSRPALPGQDGRRPIPLGINRLRRAPFHAKVSTAAITGVTVGPPRIGMTKSSITIALRGWKGTTRRGSRCPGACGRCRSATARTDRRTAGTRGLFRDSGDVTTLAETNAAVARLAPHDGDVLDLPLAEGDPDEGRVLQ